MKRIFSAVFIPVVLLLAGGPVLALDNPAGAELKRLEESGRVQLTPDQKLKLEEYVRTLPTPDREIDELGGPDDYGYAYIDSDEQGGPEFDWIDISDTGTRVTGLADDNHVGPFNIGFNFPYYGEAEDQFWIQSNGLISFFGTYVSLSNQRLPYTNGNYGAMIAWFWDDMHPRNSSVYYDNVEINGREACVIQFNNYGRFGENGTFTFEVILFESGDILIQYLEFNGIAINSSTIGIQNHDHDIGLEVLYNGNPANYPSDETALLFYLPDRDASVSGNVTDSETGEALEGVAVAFGAWLDTTDANGDFSIEELFSGFTLPVSLTLEGYFEYQDTVELEVGENTYDVEMDILSGDLTGIVTDEETQGPILNAVVEAYIAQTGDLYRVDSTDANGEYNLPALHHEETYQVVAKHATHGRSDTVEVTIDYEQENTQNFSLPPIHEVNIEQLQTGNYVNRWVSTSGIVTQGTNTTTTEATSFYIQDGTGYGVWVWNDSAWVEDDLVRGDEIALTGLVEEYDRNNRITEYSEYGVELVSRDNPMPEPMSVATGDLSDQLEYEGTFATIVGQLLGNPGNGDYSLLINDGSGIGSVFIYEATGIDLSEYQADDWMRFDGVIMATRTSVRIVPSEVEDITYIPIVPPTDLAAETEETYDPLQLHVTLTWNHPENMEVDDFRSYIVYRDDAELTRVQEPTYTDVIDFPGEYGEYTYVYEVSANYDEAESDRSVPYEVIWNAADVTERKWSDMPAEYSVAGIYPNPFNPTLNVVVGLPEAAPLHAAVYNLTGRKIADLADADFQPGYHTLSFNGMHLASGIYFVRVDVPGQLHEMRKVVLLK